VAKTWQLGDLAIEGGAQENPSLFASVVELGNWATGKGRCKIGLDLLTGCCMAENIASKNEIAFWKGGAVAQFRLHEAPPMHVIFPYHDFLVDHGEHQ
jgi:hypothetical protein